MKARTLTNVHHLVGEADVCDVCVILCVSVSTCVATASMWKLADHVSYQSLSSTLVEAGSDFCCCHYFVFVCLFCYCILQAKPWSSCLHLVSLCRSSGFMVMCYLWCWNCKPRPSNLPNKHFFSLSHLPSPSQKF